MGAAREQLRGGGVGQPVGEADHDGGDDDCRGTRQRGDEAARPAGEQRHLAHPAAAEAGDERPGKERDGRADGIDDGDLVSDDDGGKADAFGHHRGYGGERQDAPGYERLRRKRRSQNRAQLLAPFIPVVHQNETESPPSTVSTWPLT